jgi:uncharacterized protein (TIGR03437 family)
LSYPYGVAVDASGNVYIADSSNSRIRVVSTSGTITTIAGNGIADYSGDGGPAISAELNNPYSVLADASGTLYITDTDNGAIRLLTPVGSQPALTVNSLHTGSFTPGQSGTYNLTVTNAASSATTNGLVAVSEYLPSGLTLNGISGKDWSCNSNTCSRSDPLSAGLSYPALTATVNVQAEPPAQVTNRVSVSGGGAATTGASDLTLITSVNPIGPVISNVQDAESARTSVVPGEWAAIYGANLAVSSRTWAAADFTNGNALPTSIDGVSVQFGGVASAVYYVSPTQIDVQVPDGISGSVPAIVTLNRTQSASFMTTVLPSAPSLYVYQGGSVLYAAATHADGSLIGDPAVTAGATKAGPGETIVLYVNGLDTSPSGTIISTPVPYGNPVTVTVKSMNAPVTFAGLVAAGEFQVNVVVPIGLAAGNYPITVGVGSQVSPANVMLPVQ